MPRRPDGSVSIETIGDHIDEGYRISVHCERSGCHNSKDIDLEALAIRLGRDHLTLAKHLKPYFRCGKCGSKEMGFILSPPAPQDGVVTPSDQPDLTKR